MNQLPHQRLIACGLVWLVATCIGSGLVAQSAQDLFADIDKPDAASTEMPATATSQSAASPDAALADGILKLYGTSTATLPIPVDPDNLGYGDEAKKPKLHNLAGLDYSSPQFHFVSEWLLDLAPDLAGQAATAPTTGADSWPGVWNNFVRLRPSENYLAWTPAGFRLSLGYQIFAWGSADGANPTDHLNARDYAAGLHGPKIPLLAAAASWYPAEWLSVDAVFAPLAPTDSYPVDFAGEIPDSLFYGMKLSAAFSPVPFAYPRSVNYHNPAQDLTSFVAAGKINFRTSALDVALSYISDLDNYYTPVLTVSRDPVYLNDNVTPSGNYFVRVSDISLQRLRMHRFGLDLKASVDRFGIWLESAWNMTQGWNPAQADIRSPDLVNTLGMDFNWGPDDKFYANIQMMSDYIPWFYAGGSSIDQTRTSDTAYMKSFYSHQLQGLGSQDATWSLGWALNLNFPMLDARFKPGLTIAYTLPVAYDTGVGTRFGAMVLNPQIELSPLDSFHILIGAQLQYAWIQLPGTNTISLDRSVDKIGRFIKDNQVYLQFVFNWNQDITKK